MSRFTQRLTECQRATRQFDIAGLCVACLFKSLFIQPIDKFPAILGVHSPVSSQLFYCKATGAGKDG
jgi:hypothetical protein